MPYGPNGQWRPADPGACAKLVCDISTGDSPEVYAPPPQSEDERRFAAMRASKGGRAKAAKQHQRHEVTASAAKLK